MADSAVAVTAGSGTNIDTRTEASNGNHRQVIVVGDPSTNAGVAPVDGTAGLKVDLGADNDVTISGDALTALQLIDDAIYADDADFSDGSSKFALTGGLYQSSPQSITDGDVGPFQVDANGRLLVKAAANSGVDIGDVDVTTVVAGTGATNLGKAEDAAHSSGDTGVAILGVRRDAKAVGSGTDGDYSTLNVTANGDLRVDGKDRFIVKTTPTVTAGAYTIADCFGGKQTIANAARVSGGGGTIRAVSMFDEGANILADDIEVIFFDSDPSNSTFSDNGALAIVDADGPKIIGSVILGTRRDTGDGGFIYTRNLDIPYVCDGGTSLYAVAVHLDTTAPDATDGITFVYHLERD